MSGRLLGPADGSRSPSRSERWPSCFFLGVVSASAGVLELLLVPAFEPSDELPMGVGMALLELAVSVEVVGVGELVLGFEGVAAAESPDDDVTPDPAEDPLPPPPPLPSGLEFGPAAGSRIPSSEAP